MAGFTENSSTPLNIVIRPEMPGDYRAVEELTREAFWRPERVAELGVGCTEHYMVHSLRQQDGIMQLDFVAETDGQVVGHVIYSQAYILQPDGGKKDVLNFGPLSVLPEYQKRGVGSALMKHSIQCAKQMGYGAIFFFGHPTYYPRFGFVEAKAYGVTTSTGKNFPAFMAMELAPGYLKNVTGRFIEAPIYNDELNKGQAAEFDKSFPAKQLHKPSATDRAAQISSRQKIFLLCIVAPDLNHANRLSDHR